MTELEWLTCTDPEKMLVFFGAKASERKLRLFAVACCGRVMPSFTNRASLKAVDVAERFADGPATAKERKNARASATKAFDGFSLTIQAHDDPRLFVMSAPRFVNDQEVISAAWGTLRCCRAAIAPENTASEDSAISSLLRDIFGNPFRPLPPRPESIAPLAEQIYAGAWDQMPLLGEWLQEHGYWSEGEHCLDPNNHHVKGCWVVDWVTGRE